MAHSCIISSHRLIVIKRLYKTQKTDANKPPISWIQNFASPIDTYEDCIKQNNIKQRG